MRTYRQCGLIGSLTLLILIFSVENPNCSVKEMNNLTIVTLFFGCFQINFAFPNVSNRDTSKLSNPDDLLQHQREPPISNHESDSSTELESTPLEPRDILSDILGPPLRNIFGYLGSNLYALRYTFFSPPPPPPPRCWTTSARIGIVMPCKLQVNGHKIMFGNGSTLPPLQNPNVAEDIPIQSSTGNVIVVGKNGYIYVNRSAKYYDRMLRKGEVHIRIYNGDFYVNNNLVMKKDPRRILGNYLLEGLDHYRVTEFSLRIEPDGYLHYFDDYEKEYFHINYYAAERLE